MTGADSTDHKSDQTGVLSVENERYPELESLDDSIIGTRHNSVCPFICSWCNILVFWDTEIADMVLCDLTSEMDFSRFRIVPVSYERGTPVFGWMS